MKYFVGIFTWVVIASAWPTAAQQLEAGRVGATQPADTRINHDVDVENWRILNIFLYLLRGTGLHGGFVEMAGCSDLPKGHLQIGQGLTVRQAMDALVAANPGYQWDVEDGVVNLIPRGGVPLLHTRITKFQKDATDQEIEAVLQDVLRLPEVQRRAASLGLQQSISGGGLSGGSEHPVPRPPMRVQFIVENLSLQDTFNKIVQPAPKGVWLYHETDCNAAKTFVVEVASDY